MNTKKADGKSILLSDADIESLKGFIRQWTVDNNYKVIEERITVCARQLSKIYPTLSLAKENFERMMTTRKAFIKSKRKRF